MLLAVILTCSSITVNTFAAHYNPGDVTTAAAGNDPGVVGTTQATTHGTTHRTDPPDPPSTTTKSSTSQNTNKTSSKPNTGTQTDPPSPPPPPSEGPGAPGAEEGEVEGVTEEQVQQIIEAIQAINIEQNVYVDVPDQFWPTVGNLYSLNNSRDVYLNGNGSVKEEETRRRLNIPIGTEVTEEDIKKVFPGYTGLEGGDGDVENEYPNQPPCVWAPSYGELPYFAEDIGRQYNYAVLTKDYWSTDQMAGVLEHDGTVATSWPYKRPEHWSGLVGVDEDKIYGEDEESEEEGGAGSGTPDASDSDSDEEEEEEGNSRKDAEARYKRMIIDEWELKQKKNYLYFDETKKKYLAVTDTSKYKAIEGKDAPDVQNEVFSDWAGTIWYKDTDNRVTTQSDRATLNSTAASLYPDAPEDVRRALNILGYDILLRDEYVTQYEFPSGKGDNLCHSFGYYYDSVTDTYNLFGKESTTTGDTGDEDNELHQAPLTLDYIVQCLYRTMGIYCLNYEIFFFEDPNHTVDTSSLAQTITVAMDQVNEAQNRVDVFVTRTGLDNYWERAVFDALVTENGEQEYDLINAPKARHVDIKGNNFVKYKLVKEWDDTKGDKGGMYVRTLVESKVDTARKKVLTLAEFCELARSFMNLYGEEVMTKQEEEILLLTYGSLLPYDISDEEQFEAIKYLMAKGIVNSGMGWSDPLKLDDLLVILSRIRDKGSRLTFKEVQITYDPALLERGYYPANMTFDDNPAARLVQVTYNKDYDVKEREWIDFFVKQDRELEFEGSDPEYKDRLFSTYFTHYDEAGNAVRDVHDLYLVTDKYDKDGSSDNPEFNKVDAEHMDKDNIQIDLKPVYMNSYAYVHFRVRASCIYNSDGSLNNKYVYTDSESKRDKGAPAGHFITINSTNPLDEPMRWQVEACGGIFDDPHIRKCTKGDKDDDEDSSVVHYVVSYSAYGHYGKAFEGYSVESKDEVSVNKEGTKKEDARHIDADDWDELWEELKIVPSQVLTRDEDNYVLTYFRIDEKTDNDSECVDEYSVKDGDSDKTIHLLKSNDHHRTFDEANFDISYVDHQRYETSYARYLSKSNYLDEEEASETISSTSPYKLIFAVQCASTEDTATLIGDVYWGDMDEGKVAIHKSDPTHPANPNIEYLSFSDNRYRYVVNNVADSKAVQNELHIATQNGSATPEFINGLAYAKDTFLVSADELINQAEANGMSGMSLYNGAIISVTDDAIMLSFDTHSTSGFSSVRSSPLTIFVSESLRVVSVGNIIHKVPTDEILYYKDTSGVKPVYWLNYRVIQGWASGFTVTTVNSTTDSNGTIVIEPTGSDWNKQFSYSSSDTIANYYTKQEEYFYVREYTATEKKKSEKGKEKAASIKTVYLLPMSSPYITSNCFIYDSGEIGRYAVTLKNSDSQASNGILSDLNDEDADVKKMWNNYMQGADFMINTLGMSLSSSGFVKDSPILTSIYPISNTLYTVEDLYLQAMPDKSEGLKDDEKVDYGYFFEDKELLEWYYVIPEISDIKEVDDLREMYYTGLLPMPIFRSGDIQNGTTALYQNFSSNVISGAPYGVYPNGVGKEAAKAENSIVLPADVLIDPSTYTEDHPYVTAYLNEAKEQVTFEPSSVIVCPVGSASLVLNAYFDPELQTFVNKAKYGYYGNYWTTLHYETGGTFSQSFISSTTKNFYGNTSRTPITSLELLGSTVTTYWFNTGPSYFTTTASRDAALQQAVHGELADADDIPLFDWNGFQFDSLVTGSNSVLNVILIIVLNIIPRIAIFICLTLIALSVIANIKPWRKFCIDVFDIYKGISLGNVTVETVNTQRLLISSIVGLAFFALFMDGTMINVLVWIVKSVSGIIER